MQKDKNLASMSAETAKLSEYRRVRRERLKQMPVRSAIVIYLLAIVAISPLMLIANEKGSFTPNICALIYLFALMLFSYTHMGKKILALIDLATERLFGVYPDEDEE